MFKFLIGFLCLNLDLYSLLNAWWSYLLIACKHLIYRQVLLHLLLTSEVSSANLWIFISCFFLYLYRKMDKNDSDRSHMWYTPPPHTHAHQPYFTYSWIIIYLISLLTKFISLILCTLSFVSQNNSVTSWKSGSKDSGFGLQLWLVYMKEPAPKYQYESLLHLS